MASRSMKKLHGHHKSGGGVHHHHHYAKGGSVKEEKAEDSKPEHDYNAQGSKELAEAKEHEGSFKSGGKAPGGHKKRLDKRARGGRTSTKGAMGGGHNPYSSAKAESMPASDQAGKGHMGEMPAEID